MQSDQYQNENGRHEENSHETFSAKEECSSNMFAINQESPFWLQREMHMKEYAECLEYFKKKVMILQNNNLKHLLNQNNADLLQNSEIGPYTHCGRTIMNMYDIKPNEKSLSSLQFSMNGSYLVLGYESGNLKVHNYNKHSFEEVVDAFPELCSITNIRFKNEENNVFFASNIIGNICVFKHEFNEWITKYTIKELENEINAMDINNFGDRLVTGGKDWSIKVYDITEKPTVVSIFKGFTINCEELRNDSYKEDEGHYSRIFALRFHPEDSNILFSGGWDNSVKMWDLRVPNYPVRNFFGPHIYGDSIDVTGNRLITGQWSAKNGVQVWDTSSSRLLKTLQLPNRASRGGFDGEFIYCLRLVKPETRPSQSKNWVAPPDGDIIAIGGGSLGGMEVCSISEDHVIGFYPEERPIVALDTNKSLIAFGGTGNYYYLTDFIPYIERKEKKQMEEDHSEEESDLSEK